MEELGGALRRIFPFCKSPVYSYEASIDNGMRIKVSIAGSSEEIDRWCETLGFSSPMDFICPLYSDIDKNRFYKEMGQTHVTAESWGFTDMKVEFNAQGIFNINLVAMSMNFPQTLQTFTKMGNIVAELYLNDAVDEAILEVKRLKKVEA